MFWPPPFGRDLTKEEAYIAKLDASTGASLKLTAPGLMTEGSRAMAHFGPTMNSAVWSSLAAMSRFWPPPFGRDLTKEEAYIAKLDASTGASLKLTVLKLASS
jgi:hypothetical protein